MNALHGLRDTIHIHEGSPLQMWLKRHGARTITKYNDLVNVGGVGPVTFQAETPTKTFTAYIDQENKFATVDKFSQVMDTCYILVLSCQKDLQELSIVLLVLLLFFVRLLNCSIVT